MHKLFCLWDFEARNNCLFNHVNNLCDTFNK
uniref:Uncharacterized protein n=1 Tax=Rhizophora mucronata TaxID=61149 RepID=A0A2P2PJH3_RHIMU